MPGFLLTDDAEDLRKQAVDEFKKYADEQMANNQKLVDNLLNPGLGQPAPRAPAQPAPAPPPAPIAPAPDQNALMAYLNSPLGSKFQQVGQSLADAYNSPTRQAYFPNATEPNHPINVLNAMQAKYGASSPQGRFGLLDEDQMTPEDRLAYQNARMSMTVAEGGPGANARLLLGEASQAENVQAAKEQAGQWVQEHNQPPFAPSLPHTEEPASATDHLSDRWKTQFDFGATYTGDYRSGTPHRGVDLVPTQGGIGTEVDAFAPGTVTNISRDSGAGGLMVYVQDDQGLTHAYMHLASAAPNLAVGQRVARGTPIATMGESGTEGSPHLHYEVRKNAATGDPLDQLIDPRPYVAGQRQTTGATGFAAQAGAPTTSPGGTQTTAGLSGGGPQAGQIGDAGQQILSGAAQAASWLGEQGQKALQAILVTEGGLTGARGDNRSSAGPLQFFGEEGGRGGQLNAFANALGMSLEQARQYAIDHPLEAVRWAVGVPSNPGYLGKALLDGIGRNLSGPELATYAQRNGQVSVSPERAGAVWESLFGQGQSAVSGASQTLLDTAQGMGRDVLNRGQDILNTGQGLVQSTAASANQALNLGQNQPDPFAQQRQDMQDRLARGSQDLQGMFSQGAQDIQNRFGQMSRDYSGRLGTATQQLGQGNPIMKAIMPVGTPGDVLQGLAGPTSPVRQVADALGQMDEQATGAMADAAIARLRQAGINPTPEQEQFARTAFKAFSPSTLPLAFVGGAGGLLPRLGLAAEQTVAGGLGMAAGEAAGQAVAPHLPEPLRPYAPLAGSLLGGFGGPAVSALGRQGLGAAARSPGVREFIRDESGELRFGGQPEPGPEAARAGQPAPEPVAPEGPTMGGGTVGISQSPTFLRESLRRMYPGAINKAAAKEATQNSVDASRGILGAETHVSVDNQAKTISIVDQGKGMTPQTMEDVFVKLGGSSKPAGSSGGMGTAIKAIMANAEDTWVRTIGRDPNNPSQLTDSVMHGSGDDFLGGTMHRYYAPYGELPPSELAGAPPEITNLDISGTTGTAIWTRPMADVNWDAGTLNSWVSNFNRTSRVADQNVRFTVDGQEIDPNTRMDWSGKPQPIAEHEKPTQFLKTIDTPGAQIDFYGSPETSETGYASVSLLNNGQYQADQFVQLPGNAKMPRSLVADVRSTVDPKGVGYPWTADRNALIDNVQRAVKDYVGSELATDLINQENTRIGESIRNAPQLGMVKMVDDAGIANSFAADTLARIPKHTGYRRLANLVNDLHEALISELEGRVIPSPGGEGTIGPSHLVGLAVSQKWLGLNVPPSFTPWAGAGDEAKGILIEPWQVWKEVERSWPNASREEQISKYAEGLLGTMLHEITHNTAIGGHEEGFAGLLTRIPQFLGSRMQTAILGELRKRLTTAWDTLAEDLVNDSTTFGLAARESQLARYGTEAGTAVPRGGRPAVGGDNPALYDQGGPGGGRRAGGPEVPAGGPAEGLAPQPELAATGDDVIAQAVRAKAKKPVSKVRAQQATESLAASIARIKPTLTKKQVAAVQKTWAELPRKGSRVMGAPPGIDTVEDYAALRQHLTELIDDGVAGKDWYINSAHKIKEAVGGDLVEAEKLAQLVGMMARNVNPEQNVNYAIEAWNQWKAGVPVANVHRFSDVSKEAADLLERGIQWEGRKTNSFYINLMEELDPKLLAQKKVTADIWVNRAFGYHGNSPAGGQYTFMEDELRRIAAQRGERPSQVQAQLWVGQMARQAPNADGAADFSHALTRRMGQVGWETAPGTGEIPGYMAATPEAQAAYNREVGEAFLDENGVDLVTRALGALGGHSFEAPGVWLGEVSPGWQTQVAVASTAKATPGGATLRPASRSAIESVAAAKGYLLSTLPDNKQNAVGWTQVFPAANPTAANAMDINVGRLLTVQEAHELAARLTQEMAKANPLTGEEVPFILTSTERGAWLRNTSDMPNPKFHKAVDAALRGVQSDGSATTTPMRADSDLVFNDWRTQPNGEGYLEAIRRGGREKAFRSIQDSLGAKVAAVQQSAAEKYFGAGKAASTEAAEGLPGAADAGAALPDIGDFRGPFDWYGLDPEAPNAEALPNLGEVHQSIAEHVRALGEHIARQTGQPPEQVLADLQRRARGAESPAEVMRRLGPIQSVPRQNAEVARQIALERRGGGAGVPPPTEPGAPGAGAAPEPPTAGGFPVPGSQNLASMGLGGLGGAASDEDLTPEERLKRGLGGALIAGAVRRPGAVGQAGRLLGDVRGVLRGATPAQSSAQAVAAAQGAKTGGQHVAEFISSNLLSGPGLIWNVLNQTGHLGWQPLQRAVEGHPMEALTALHSLIGSPEAFSRAGAVLGRGTPYAGVGGVQSRPLDKASVGLRANLAGDAVMRTWNENMAGMLEAQRLIREAGARTPQAAADVISKNAVRIQEYAEKHGNISALTGAGGRSPWIQSLGETKTRLLQSPELSKQLGGLAMHILMPFARVPEEVLYQTVRNSPILGQAIDAFQFVKAAPGEKGQAASKMALNAAIASGVIGAAIANEIRSADDPEHPNQAHIGNSWVPLTSLGTLGGRMALAAAVADGIRYPKKPGVEQQIATAINNIGKVGVQEYPLFDTIRTLGRIGQGGLTSVASGLGSQVLSGLTPVSGALGAAENIVDPYQRDVATSGWGDVYEPNLARIPGLAGSLPTRVNQASGEPLLKQSSGPGSLLRMQNQPKTQGKLAQEIANLERAGYPIPNPQDNPESVSYKGSSMPLSRDEGRAVAVARGQMITEQLEQYINSPYWAQLTDLEKAQIITRVMGGMDQVGVATLSGQLSPTEFQDRYMGGRPENRPRVGATR